MKITKSFLHDIRSLITSARTTIARGVDLIQVHTNFQIGRRIVEQEQKGKDRADYGGEIIKALSERLTDEFGSGFSISNLKSMRQFYLQYQHRIGQTLSGQSIASAKSQSMTDQSAVFQPSSGKALGPQKLQSPTAKSSLRKISQSMTGQLPPDHSRPFSLSWSHYVFLLTIQNPEERSFYEIESTSQNWTVRELKRQYDSSLYERLALSRDKKGIRKLAQKGQIIDSFRDVLKEPLVLEFLDLHEQSRYSESDLESAIISQIERFLLELGKGFLFEARQRRFTFDADHYFVDLVFYNRILRAYVLIDLKLGKLTHQDLGQMLMYVNYFDQYIKSSDESPTIGIILCKQKNKTLVRITLPKNSNILAHEYQLYLPSKETLQRKLAEWTSQLT